jgi:hypothetical protein
MSHVHLGVQHPRREIAVSASRLSRGRALRDVPVHGGLGLEPRQTACAHDGDLARAILAVTLHRGLRLPLRAAALVARVPELEMALDDVVGQVRTVRGVHLGEGGALVPPRLGRARAAEPGADERVG